MGSPDLVVNISSLPPEGLKFSGFEPQEEINLILKEKGGDFRFSEPIHWELFIFKSHDTISAEAKLSGKYTCLCSRCVKELERSISVDFRHIFIPLKDEMLGEAEDSDEMEELSFYEEEKIDLSPVIHEQILLSLPSKPLCREDCRGLCPKCYHDLNSGPCGCEVDTVDPRLAALKNFKDN
jgi:uncharacterized protein